MFILEVVGVLGSIVGGDLEGILYVCGEKEENGCMITTGRCGGSQLEHGLSVCDS